MNRTHYTIGELAERTGVSRRTVHYYVQRGLIDPAEGRGRAGHYTERHVAQILEIRARQRDGVPLESLRESRDAPPPAGTAVSQPPAMLRARTVVVRVRLAEGLVLEVSGRGRVPSDEVLDRLAGACADVLDQDEGPDAIG